MQRPTQIDVRRDFASYHRRVEKLHSLAGFFPKAGK